MAKVTVDSLSLGRAHHGLSALDGMVFPHIPFDSTRGSQTSPSDFFSPVACMQAVFREPATDDSQACLSPYGP